MENQILKVLLETMATILFSEYLLEAGDTFYNEVSTKKGSAITLFEELADAVEKLIPEKDFEFIQDILEGEIATKKEWKAFIKKVTKGVQK